MAKINKIITTKVSYARNYQLTKRVKLYISGYWQEFLALFLQNRVLQTEKLV